MPLYSPEQTALHITISYHQNGNVFHRDFLYTHLHQHAFTLAYLFNGNTVPNLPISLFGDHTFITLAVRPATYSARRLENADAIARDGRGDDPVDRTIREEYVQVE